MKLIYTEQSLRSFEETLNFSASKFSYKKLMQIRDDILYASENLLDNPFGGQVEPYFEHLGLGHRRIGKDHYKIIYRVVDNYVYITDIFGKRQDPTKMKA